MQTSTTTPPNITFNFDNCPNLSSKLKQNLAYKENPVNSDQSASVNVSFVTELRNRYSHIHTFWSTGH